MASPIGTCPFCGATNVELTDEHVFPKAWYPAGTPQDAMLIVPGCWPCNQRHGKIESRMFLPLVLQLDDPRANEIQERAMRSADKAAGRNAKDAAFRDRAGRSFMERARVHAPGTDLPTAMWSRTGPQIGQIGELDDGTPVVGIPTIKFEWSDVEALAIKFLRGCYFASYAEIMPQEPAPWALSAVKDPRRIIAELAATPGAIARGGFPFWYVIARAPSGITIAHFVLWDHDVWFAANRQRPSDV